MNRKISCLNKISKNDIDRDFALKISGNTLLESLVKSHHKVNLIDFDSIELANNILEIFDNKITLLQEKWYQNICNELSNIAQDVLRKELEYKNSMVNIEKECAKYMSEKKQIPAMLTNNFVFYENQISLLYKEANEKIIFKYDRMLRDYENEKKLIVFWLDDKIKNIYTCDLENEKMSMIAQQYNMKIDAESKKHDTPTKKLPPPTPKKYYHKRYDPKLLTPRFERIFNN